MRTSSANGWQFFVATLMIVIGAINIVQGVVALVTPGFYAVTETGMLVWEYGAWGALLGIWGAVLVIAGLAVLSGSTWARVFGVVLAAINIIAQLAFLVAMPLWSVVAIAVNVLVIYGMTAGWPSAEEMEPERQEAAYRSGYRAAHEAPRGAKSAQGSTEQSSGREQTTG
ncbi:hypothetical protein KIK06_13680 [Nocardiopsis sp. EMB25]|uniref:DUF7144 family membrane protein n=1 Tax=Nocardiopsis TaxID=2013 RepID=UPI000345E0D0|nr:MULTISPECIES: hypothetical protein [Nocardiopsis]MCY9784938.1 hypothetical protein [Nocardiopsis sp. EMB25]